jgi:hypothetical protein
MAHRLTDAGSTAEPTAPAEPSDGDALPNDDGTAAPAEHPQRAGRTDRWRERLGSPGAAIAVTLLPFAVGIVALLVAVGGDYHPVHDLAQIELRIRDVGHHEVLLGPYSRDGWYHPGPAMFYLLALPYRLTGGASVGMDVGALLINGAAVAGMALVARRRGGTPLLLITLLACGLLVRSLGADFLRDPWNPSLPVLSFGLVLFLCWAMTCGEVWALPIGVAVASFVVQTHIGYLALATPLLVWGAGWLVWLAVKHPDEVPRRRLAKAGLVTAAVGAVLWAPAVIQQVTTEPGNLGEAFEYFRLTSEPAHSLADGWRVLAAQFTLNPEWIGGNRTLTITGEPTALYGGAPLPLLLIPLVAAAVVLWRRGGSDARRLVLTLALALGFGLLAVANTTGLAFMYRLRWVEVLAMTAGVVVAWAAWLWVDARLRAETRAHDGTDAQACAQAEAGAADVHDPPAAPTAPAVLDGGAPSVLANDRAASGAGSADRAADAVRRRLGIAAVAAIVALAAVTSVGSATAGTPQAHESRAMAALLPDIEAGLPPGEDPVLIRPTSFGSMLFVPAMLLALERDGVAARIDPVIAAVGEHRLFHPGDPLRAQLAIFVDEDIPARLHDPSLELVARWGDPPRFDPDDPVDAYEAAFPTGDIAVLEQFARDTLDEAGDLRLAYTVRAVAVFSVRPGHRLGPPPDPAATAPSG